MFNVRWLVALALVAPGVGCKTKGGGAQVAAWELNGNKDAANRFIVDTVKQFYPDVAGAGDVIQQFATALADQRTDQTESAQYVLETYWQESKAGTTSGERSPIQQYIIEQFIVLTNYTAFVDKTEAALKYVGSAKT